MVKQLVVLALLSLLSGRYDYDAHILRLGSVEDAFLPDSMDHMIVELRRDLPRSLWTVHSYHPPVLGTEVTGSTLHASTLTWKTNTIRKSGLPRMRVVHRLLHILTAKAQICGSFVSYPLAITLSIGMRKLPPLPPHGPATHTHTPLTNQYQLAQVCVTSYVLSKAADLTNMYMSPGKTHSNILPHMF